MLIRVPLSNQIIEIVDKRGVDEISVEIGLFHPVKLPAGVAKFADPAIKLGEQVMIFDESPAIDLGGRPHLIDGGFERFDRLKGVMPVTASPPRKPPR